MNNEQFEKHLESLANRLPNAKDTDCEKLKEMLQEAINLVLDYTNRNKMIDSLYLYARQLVIIAWNREGTEGETSRSEGGISQSFIEGIPSEIKSGLNRHRVASVRSFS